MSYYKYRKSIADKPLYRSANSKVIKHSDGPYAVKCPFDKSVLIPDLKHCSCCMYNYVSTSKGILIWKKLEKKSIIIPLFWSYFIIEGEKQGFTVSESPGHPDFGRIVYPSIGHKLKPLTKLLSKEKFNLYKERQWKWRQRIIGSLLIYNGKQCGMTNATG